MGVSMSPGATTLARTPRRAASYATCRGSPPSGAFDGAEAGGGPRRVGGAGGHRRQSRLAHEEVRPHVDGKRPVPVVAAGALETAAFADADVQDQPVEPAESRFGTGDDGGTVLGSGDVGGEHLGAAAV